MKIGSRLGVVSKGFCALEGGSIRGAFINAVCMA